MMVTASTTQSTTKTGRDTMPVHERPSRCFPDPARRRGERARGERRGKHGAGRESERREHPAGEAENVRTVRLVEVEAFLWQRFRPPRRRCCR